MTFPFCFDIRENTSIMKSKIQLFALLSFVIFSCSSDGNSETNQNLEEEFIVTIDKDTPNEIVIDIDNPHATIPCRTHYFTAPDIESNGIELSNIAFFVPGVVVIDLETVEVGETIIDLGAELPESNWGFSITIDGIEYEALSGTLSFNKYDDSDWIANAEPIIISGVLEVVIIETNGSETRTLLINFNNVQSPFSGAC